MVSARLVLSQHPANSFLSWRWVQPWTVNMVTWAILFTLFVKIFAPFVLKIHMPLYLTPYSRPFTCALHEYLHLYHIARGLIWARFSFQHLALELRKCLRERTVCIVLRCFLIFWHCASSSTSSAPSTLRTLTWVYVTTTRLLTCFGLHSSSCMKQYSSWQEIHRCCVFSSQVKHR